MVYNILQEQMDKLDDLLPGIENFLRRVLLKEHLSNEAERFRQYYVERLDILQLPPTVPPQPSDDAEPLHSPQKKEVKSPSPNRHLVVATVEEDDFAAYQREIARSQLCQVSGLLDSDSEDEKGVKVYDDIDQDQGDNHGNSQRKCSLGGEDSNWYEIPVLKRLPCQQEKTNDYEESVTENKAVDTIATEVAIHEEPPDTKPPPLPPPLPPRRDRSTSDAHSRSSVGSALEEKLLERPPNLPIRPNLAPKSLIHNIDKSEKCDTKSEKSNDTMDDDLDDLDGGTSYESYDDELQQDTEMMNKLNIKLPKPLKKQKKHVKHSKARSSKEWDVALSFNCLEEVTLSGELHYKGKLSWTRKLVALAEGKMMCYKPEKADNKPALVINLIGYEASYTERDSRKGFDIRLMHPALEMHHFSVDFKDWASMWCEYISAMAQGKPPPGQYHHLARGSTFGGLDSSHVYGSKTNLGHSFSNISTCSSADNLEFDSSSLKKKKRKNSRKVNRMGSIAFRATQFFESIGKKSGKRVQTNMPTSISLGNVKERLNSSTSSHGFSPLTTPTSQPELPVFEPPETPKIQESKRPPLKPGVKHQGHLFIFSSFNRRRWGQRWCVVRNSMFECYRTQSSTVCELEIWLRNCFLHRAVDETKSQLGLMLVEKNVEKIIIEPVTAEEMSGWLHVLMNETMTQELPTGLEEFWVEDPYNDIKSEDLNSPLSDVFGYSIMDDEIPKQQDSYHHYDLEDADDLDGSSVTLRMSADREKSQRLTSLDMSNADNAEIHIVGQVTGELYSQVQRKSSSLSYQDIERARQTVINSNVNMNEGRLEECDGNSYPGSPGSFGASFDQSSESAEGSMFAEIITKINRHFSRENDQGNCEVSDHDSEKNTDTAYNSAVCSENSSLERKNKSGQSSLSHSQNNLDSVSQNDPENSNNDLDTLSQVTDILVSPIEDFQEMFDSKSLVQIEVTRAEDDIFNSNIQTEDQSDDGVALMDQSDLSRTADFSENQSCDLHEVTKMSSRDQCDSAIYEGESLIEEDPSQVMHKIEQLRTHLVELKDKRISIRDLKNQTVASQDREELETEYNQLDSECKSVSEQILLLEQQVQ